METILPIKVKKSLRLKKHEIEKYNIFVDVLFKMFDEDTRVINTGDDAIIKAIIQLAAEGKDISKIREFQNDITACAEKLNYINRYTGDDLYALASYEFHKNGWYKNLETTYTGDVGIFETIISHVVDPSHVGKTEITLFDGDGERIVVINFGKTEDGKPFVDVY